MLTKLFLTLLLPQLAIAPLTFSGAVRGVTISVTPGLHKVNANALEPIIEAPSAVVIDAGSGQILFKKKHDEQRPVASITKLVTVYAYLQKTAYDFEKEIRLEAQDMRGGGAAHVYEGERVSARDIIHLALIASDNTAAAALTRAAGLDAEFPEHAKEILDALGLQNTIISEPTGLDSENASTALDIAKLGGVVFQDSAIREVIGRKSYTFEPIGSRVSRKIITTNDLLDTQLFAVLGGKTGYTKEAGYCLVIKIAHPKTKKEIIVAILGADSSEARFQDAKALAWWVFSNFE